MLRRALAIAFAAFTIVIGSSASAAAVTPAGPTLQAASAQKRTNGQPPSHAMPIAIGAITADEMIRKVRLLRARACVADT